MRWRNPVEGWGWAFWVRVLGEVVVVEEGCESGFEVCW